MNADDSTRDKVGSVAEEETAPLASGAGPSTAIQSREQLEAAGDEAGASKSEADSNAPKTDVGASPDEEHSWDDEEEQDETDEQDEDSVIVDDLTPGTDDPLAPAFDLDQGEEICKQTVVGPVRGPWRTKMESPREFFNTEILYRFDIIEPEDREALKGTCRIELRGQNGGTWMLKVGEQLSISNESEEAEVVLSMQQQDFMNIVNGLLNPQLALLGQKMKVEGNLRRAFAYQTLLAPSQE